MSDTTHDCVVIGGGPAGLTAAIYLSRFMLRTLVIDGGESRCATIPRTRNHAGFPDGIAGAELLQRMRAQAAEFGTDFVDADATDIARPDDGRMRVAAAGRAFHGRTVLLATGVVNHRPRMNVADHDVALERGLIRYCPICDGYEAADSAIGVLGTREHGYKEAMFLRMYSRTVTLIAPDACHELSDDQRRSLADLGIAIAEGPCDDLTLEADAIVAPTASGRLRFDTIYPALGSEVRSGLAHVLAADITEGGCLVVDAHQRTSVAGLYAAGDVTLGLDQISHAMGQAAVAATTIRNDLAEKRPLLRR